MTNLLSKKGLFMKKVLIVSALLCFRLYAKEVKLFSEDSIFLDGYDPVAYQVDQKAKKGIKTIAYTYQNIKVFFENEKNRNLFIANPKEYIPAYNGWCAYAMAIDGSLVEVDPKSFKIINGKTYLFYDGLFADTLKKWNKKDDRPQVTKADKNWKQLLNK